MENDDHLDDFFWAPKADTLDFFTSPKLIYKQCFNQDPVRIQALASSQQVSSQTTKHRKTHGTIPCQLHDDSRYPFIAAHWDIDMGCRATCMVAEVLCTTFPKTMSHCSQCDPKIFQANGWHPLIGDHVKEENFEDIKTYEPKRLYRL